MKPLAALLVLATFFASCAAQALTVEEAYAAIPHQRTVFQAGASRLSRAQVESLTRLFALSDQATVLRVEALRAYQAGNSVEFNRALAGYGPLVDALKSLRATGDVAPVQDLVLQAMQDHQHFYENRLQDSAGQSKRALVFTQEVHQASQKLRRAYGLLMQLYPNELAVNKTAFFDYLCALDFL